MAWHGMAWLSAWLSSSTNSKGSTGRRRREPREEEAATDLTCTVEHIAPSGLARSNGHVCRSDQRVDGRKCIEASKVSNFTLLSLRARCPPRWSGNGGHLAGCEAKALVYQQSVMYKSTVMCNVDIRP
jgi:hypothetical protein